LESDDDLPLVMDEIKVVMAAQGMALTLHPENGMPAQIIYVDSAAGVTHSLVERLLSEGDWGHPREINMRRWVKCELSSLFNDIFLIPIQTVAGHSRLLISVFFSNLTPDLKEAADEIDRNRRPFAIGYFRLWQLARQKSRQIGALQTALNRTEMAVFLVDKAGGIIFANGAADELLNNGAGVRLRDNVLSATQQADAGRFRAVLEHVIAENASITSAGSRNQRAPVLSLERDNLPPLMVSVLPAAERATEPGDVAAIIFAVDPSRDIEAILGSICRLYNLTHVETRLACLLASGLAFADSAKKMRLKEGTARGYLRNILTKTNTSRQTELLQLLFSSSIQISHDVIPEPVNEG
jgi:DNA-binding CsgD family transcriptional regulator